MTRSRTTGSSLDRRRLLQAAGTLALARSASAHAIRQADPIGAPAEAYDLDPAVTYLNHASIGTQPRAVREARARYAEVLESNPWLYQWGGAWTEALDAVHARMAALLGCPVEDVALPSNTTAAFGLLANGLRFDDPGRDEVLFPDWNHVGASASWQAAAAARGYRVRTFSFPEARVPELTDEEIVALYRAALSERTAVLVLPHVDNVLGLRHPVAAIARAAREAGARFVCVDGAQSCGMLPVDVPDLGVDLFAASAHKWLQAPKGTGVLVASPELRSVLRPTVVTWGRTRWAGTARVYTDQGTLDLASLLAQGDALDLHARVLDRLERHRDLFEAARDLVDDTPQLEWRSPRRFEQGAALFALGLKRGSAQEIATRLFEESGIVVRPFEGAGRNHLRVSPNLQNTPEQLERLIERVVAAIG